MEIDNILVKMKFGSHLYGTDTPESDLDFKGVFLPDIGSLIQGERVKSINNSTGSGVVKNTSGDVDEEYYSLHYFLKLALEGQTVALDMLHAPQSAILKNSHLWEVLVEQRSRFYTKNLKAFIGYARKQAAKYGIKGSRLADVRRVVKFLSNYSGNDAYKLRDVWDHLPKGEHIKFLDSDMKHAPDLIRMYQVCGKSFQETARCDYVQPILEGFLQEYGKRARQAEMNEGIDWKAMSHALRAAYQVKELFTDGTMTLPSPHRHLLTAVKQGKIDFKSVQAELETVMGVVEALSERSELPTKADHKFAKNFLYYAYGHDPTGARFDAGGSL